MKRYRVIRDLQGGEFGMGRDYTATEWLQQAREWCEADDNTDLDNVLERMQKEGARDEDILELVSDIWQIEFAPVHKIEVNGESKATPVKVKVLTKS